MVRPFVEVCVDSVAGARMARDGGADGIELCAALPVGGLTPTAATIRLARAACELVVTVLIRPRSGDFLLDDDELEQCRLDIEAARAAGADGVAVGVLRPDGTLDAERLRPLLAAARPMHVTLHRAFDLTRDLDEALEVARDLGFDRVLTSGGRRTAPEGAGNLARLVKRAGDDIVLVAAAGVRPDNVRSLVDATGVRAVHFSAGRTEASAMRHRNDDCAMGTIPVPGDYEVSRPDPDRLVRCLAALDAPDSHA